MRDVIEGRRAVEEALRAGIHIQRAYVFGATEGIVSTQSRNRAATKTQKSSVDHALNRLVDTLRKAGIKVCEVNRSRLDEMSKAAGSHGAHQGIICEVEPYRYTDVAHIAEQGSSRASALVIVLDHITDEGNLGAIIRTAEVVGALGVVIPSVRAAQVSTAVYKTSAGAALHVPIARVANIAGALEVFKRAGFWVAGADGSAEQDVWHAPLSGRIVVVAGSEGQGISRLVKQNCDFLVSLPQRGRVGSLNVAQATTAICYEWMRRVMCDVGESQ